MHRRLVLLTAGLIISAAGNVDLRAQTGAQPQPNAVAAPPGLGNGDLEILDVPFVPQSQALCGGAALAMVLRFWGEPGVGAEDFSALVLADGSAIQAAALERAVRERAGARYRSPAVSPRHSCRSNADVRSLPS